MRRPPDPGRGAERGRSRDRHAGSRHRRARRAGPQGALRAHGDGRSRAGRGPAGEALARGRHRRPLASDASTRSSTRGASRRHLQPAGHRRPARGHLGSSTAVGVSAIGEHEAALARVAGRGTSADRRGARPVRPRRPAHRGGVVHHRRRRRRAGGHDARRVGRHRGPRADSTAPRRRTGRSGRSRRARCGRASVTSTRASTPRRSSPRCETWPGARVRDAGGPDRGRSADRARRPRPGRGLPPLGAFARQRGRHPRPGVQRRAIRRRGGVRQRRDPRRLRPPPGCPSDAGGGGGRPAGHADRRRAGRLVRDRRERGRRGRADARASRPISRSARPAGASC